MLKKLLAILLFSTSVALSQTYFDFAGTQQNDLGDPQVGKWVKYANYGDGTSSIQRDGSGAGTAYNALDAGWAGAAYFDTGTVTVPYEFGVVVTQKAGSSTRDFGLMIHSTGNLKSGGAYGFTFQEQAGVDKIRFLEGNQYTGIIGGDTGLPYGGSYFNTAAGLVEASVEVSIGDTLIFRVWSDRMSGIVAHAFGGGTDSITVLFAVEASLSASLLAGTGKMGIVSTVRSTPFKFDDFFIRAPGAAPPPPAVVPDSAAPVAVNIEPSRASTTVGTAVFATVVATDDSAIATLAVAYDSGSGWIQVGNTNLSGAQTSASFTSNTFTRYNVGTITLRGIVSDKATGALDTVTNTNAISFIAAPDGGGGDSGTYTKKVYGYITFPSDINVPNPTFGGGRMPIDSLPWSVLTHTSFFAADLLTSGAFNTAGNGAAYLAKMKPIADYAHERGVFAGFCFGGSGDAGLRSVIANPSAYPTAVATMLDLIDNYNQDFIDFDLEGAASGADWTAFAALLNDSLSVRQSHNDPSVPPFIVLTVGPSRAQSSAWLASQGDVGILNLMSYDFAYNAWGQIVHDCAVTTWTNLDGTGSNLDPMTPHHNGVPFQSMQESARATRDAGWPANKIVVGADFNPTTVGNGIENIFGTGRGPQTMRQVWTTNYYPGNGSFWSGSGLKFFSNWSTGKNLSSIPADSIFFDPISKVYWAHTGTDLATDVITMQVSWPGKDSSVYYMRQMVDSMNIGGVMIWGLTETYGGANYTAPAQGHGWLSRQIEKYFGALDTITTTLEPPTSWTTANAATDQSVNLLLNWGDVATATGYGVQVNTASNFAGTMIKDTVVVASQVDLTGYLSNATPYYYRVRTQSTGPLYGTYSTGRSFTTIAALPGVPVLISPPIGGGILVLYSTTVNFAWSAPSSGGTPTHYKLQIATDAGFTAIFLNDSSTTFTGGTQALGTSGFVVGQTYYWRMYAKNAAGTGTASSTRSFTIGTIAISVPTLQEPVGGIGDQDTVNLLHRWGPVSGAISYRIQIDTSANFTTALKDTTTALLSYYKATLPASDTLYWRVKAIGSADSSVFSSSATYITSLPGTVIPSGGLEPTSPWWSPQLQAWVWKYPPKFGVFLKGKADMSDVPRPADSNVVYYNHYGRKFGFPNAAGGDSIILNNTAAGGGTGTGDINAIIDSLNGRQLAGMVLIDPVIRGAAHFQNFTDTTLETTVATSHGGIRGFSNTLPSFDGQIGTKDNPNETMSISSISLGIPLDNLSGGLGVVPQDAIAAGLDGGIWTYYEPTNTWALLPPNGLKDAPYNYLSSAGITGPKFPYLSSTTGLIAWMDSATVMATTGGGSTFDPATTITIFEDFPVNEGAADINPSAGSSAQGTHQWDGGATSGGSSPAGRTEPYNQSGAADTNMQGAVTLEGYADVAAMGTPRGVTLAGNIGTTADNFSMGGFATYRFRVKTPSAVDSSGFAIGVMDRSANDFSATPTLSTRGGIWFEFAGTGVGQDSLNLYTGNGSSSTRTNLSPALSASTWYNLKMVVGATGVLCYLNDVLVGTVTATIPANTTFGTLFLSSCSYSDVVGQGYSFDYIHYTRTVVR